MIEILQGEQHRSEEHGHHQSHYYPPQVVDSSKDATYSKHDRDSQKESLHVKDYKPARERRPRNSELAGSDFHTVILIPPG